MLGINLSLLVIMLAVGVPVFAAFIAVSLLSGMTVFNISPLVIITQMVSMLNVYILLALPMFMFAGFLMIESKAAEYLVDLFEALFGHLPGGSALALVISCAFFGALSGSTLAAIVAIGSIMLPRMKAAGYPPRFSAGLLAVSSLLAVIIPPSAFFILYCAATETSVGQVFAAGTIPGLILAATLVLGSIVFPTGRVTVASRFEWRKLERTLIKALPILGMPVVILGSIFSGSLTAVEAGALASFYIVVVDRIFYRHLSWRNFWSAARLSVLNTAMIYLLLAGVGAIVTIFLYTGFPSDVANVAKEAATPAAFIVLFMIVAAILGAILDAAPTLYLLAIVLYPTAMTLGFDPVHFGVFLTLASALGMATPPMSVGLYASASVAGISPHEAIPWVLYFAGLAFAVYFLIAFFPDLSMWTVRLIYG
jgi:C4-dicarboxylate transporter, DctM subunit